MAARDGSTRDWTFLTLPGIEGLQGETHALTRVGALQGEGAEIIPLTDNFALGRSRGESQFLGFAQLKLSISATDREDITHCGLSTPDASGGCPLVCTRAVLVAVCVPPLLDLRTL